MKIPAVQAQGSQRRQVQANPRRVQQARANPARQVHRVPQPQVHPAQVQLRVHPVQAREAFSRAAVKPWPIKIKPPLKRRSPNYLSTKNQRRLINTGQSPIYNTTQSPKAEWRRFPPL